MDFLFRHISIVQFFLWGLKDFACGNYMHLTISGETVVELNSKLNLNCQSNSPCQSSTLKWELRDDSMAYAECHDNSCNLKIDKVTVSDEMKYTCSVKCGDRTKKESVTVEVYSLPKPVLLSPPKTPWFGQPLNITCELREFYPDTVTLQLFRNDSLLETEPVKTDSEEFFVMTAILQDTAQHNTNYTCKAHLAVKNITTCTHLLVEPQEFTTVATSVKLNRHTEWSTTEDDLQTPITTEFTTVATSVKPNRHTEWSTTEDDMQTPITTDSPSPTRERPLSPRPVTLGAYTTNLPAEVLDTQSESTDVSMSSSNGEIQTSVVLYALVTLGAVACILSMGSALCLILSRRRRKQREKTNDDEEMEKENEKEKQQVPEINPQ